MYKLFNKKLQITNLCTGRLSSVILVLQHFCNIVTMTLISVLQHYCETTSNIICINLSQKHTLVSSVIMRHYWNGYLHVGRILLCFKRKACYLLYSNSLSNTVLESTQILFSCRKILTTQFFLAFSSEQC